MSLYDKQRCSRCGHFRYMHNTWRIHRNTACGLKSMRNRKAVKCECDSFVERKNNEVASS
jgi:hypothetical protein